MVEMSGKPYRFDNRVCPVVAAGAGERRAPGLVDQVIPAVPGADGEGDFVVGIHVFGV